MKPNKLRNHEEIFVTDMEHPEYRASRSHLARLLPSSFNPVSWR